MYTVCCRGINSDKNQRFVPSPQKESFVDQKSHSSATQLKVRLLENVSIIVTEVQLLYSESSTRMNAVSTCPITSKLSFVQILYLCAGKMDIS